MSIGDVDPIAMTPADSAGVIALTQLSVGTESGSGNGNWIQPESGSFEEGSVVFGAGVLGSGRDGLPLPAKMLTGSRSKRV